MRVSKPAIACQRKSARAIKIRTFVPRFTAKRGTLMAFACRFLGDARPHWPRCYVLRGRLSLAVYNDRGLPIVTIEILLRWPANKGHTTRPGISMSALLSPSLFAAWAKGEASRAKLVAGNGADKERVAAIPPLQAVVKGSG
jgi:hypothetical protein